MKYGSIPFVSQPVSRIVLGASGQRFAEGADVSDLMEAALSCGINAVDTARQYGQSEQAIGRWLSAGGNRERIVIISKCCHPAMAFVDRVNEQAAEEDLNRSLEALQTPYIDVYLLHRDNESVPVGRIVDFLNRFHEEGRIGAFGGSNWRAERIAQANAYAAAHGLKGFSVSSPHFSLGHQRHDPWGNGCRTITGRKTRRSAPIIRKRARRCWPGPACAAAYFQAKSRRRNGPSWPSAWAGGKNGPTAAGTTGSAWPDAKRWPRKKTQPRRRSRWRGC